MRNYNKPTSKSGNGKAKPIPRHLTPSQKELLKQTSKQVSVRQRNGAMQSMSVAEVLTQKYLQKASEGSVHALHQVSRKVQLAEEIEAERIEQKITKGEEFRSNCKILLEQCIKQAQDEGLSEDEVQERADDFYPHPDDVIITDKGYNFTGPYDEASLAKYHYVAKVRDAYLLQHSLDECYPKPCISGEYERYGDDIIILKGTIISEDFLKQRSAFFFALTYNNALPKRFQLSDVKMNWKIYQGDRLTKRELLRECYQKWASLNLNHPRGWLSPPMEEGIFSYQVTMKIIGKASDVAKSGEYLSDLDWIEITKETIQACKSDSGI